MSEHSVCRAFNLLSNINTGLQTAATQSNDRTFNTQDNIKEYFLATLKKNVYTITSLLIKTGFLICIIRS